MKKFEVQVIDGSKNRFILTASEIDGTMNYTLSPIRGGMNHCVSNIQFYEVKNARICWMKNATLPRRATKLTRLRVIEMLRKSTHTPIF